MQDLQILPNRLKYFRIKNGLTRKEVCTKLNITPSAISYWESGSRCPDADTLLELCELYNIRSVGQLFGEEEEPEKLTDSEQQFLDLFRKSDKDAQIAAIKLLKSW